MPSTLDIEGFETDEKGADEYLSVISPTLKSKIKESIEKME